MKLRIALGVAVCGALAAGSFFLYSRRYAVDEQIAARYEARLREISTLNYRRSSEILRARSGLVRHYDDLAKVELRLRLTHEALQRIPAFVSGAERVRLRAAVATSERVRGESEQLVERFKSELAILRNSTGFLTTLARDVALFRPATSDGVALARELDSFLRDLLALQMAHDQSTTALAKSALVEFRTKDPKAGEWTAADLPLVLRHGELAIDESGIVDQLLRELEALPTEATAAGALTAYLDARGAAVDRQKNHEAFIVALSFLGGAALASYVILRLRRAAAALERSGSALEAAVESLSEERNKQTELAELKSRFVATTSHEFRTPLSVILSSAELLSAYGERWSADKTEQHLRRIRNSAVNMTRMLEDVLLLGRAESGKLEYTPGPFRLPEFCDDLIASAELADGSSGRVQLDIDVTDAPVVADEALLRHALGNLLSNALKYSPRHEPVTLAVRIDEAAISFVIVDRGIGISPDDQRHLFRSFHRGSNVGRIRGTGLGLSIVKHAIDLQRGTVEFESALGNGTRVSVRVPLATSPEVAA